MRLRPSSLAALAAASLAAIPQHASASPDAGGSRPAVTSGRYVLRGTARADVSVLPRREHDVDALALVAPGASAGSVRLHLWSRGQACELRARVERRDVLAIPSGQTCRFELTQPDAHGTVEARLRSGSGRLREDELSLQLVWDLSGSLSTGSGKRVTLPGTSVEITLPAAPAVPVRGTVEAAASGPRDEAARGGDGLP